MVLSMNFNVDIPDNDHMINLQLVDITMLFRLLPEADRNEKRTHISVNLGLKILIETVW